MIEYIIVAISEVVIRNFVSYYIIFSYFFDEIMEFLRISNNQNQSVSKRLLIYVCPTLISFLHKECPYFSVGQHKCKEFCFLNKELFDVL